MAIGAQENEPRIYNQPSVYRQQEKIADAIECFQSALEIRTPTAFPLDCLQTGRNLGETACQYEVDTKLCKISEPELEKIILREQQPSFAPQKQLEFGQPEP